MSDTTTALGVPVGASVRVEEILDETRDLPTIPEVIVRIWQLVDDPKTGARDLEEVVCLEPPLAAKVLRLANSPYYGGRGRVEDVRMAITTLGFEVLRNLTVCLGVAQALRTDLPGNEVLDAKALWRHSVATAVLSRRLALDLGVDGAERIFSAGLLHDLGRFVLALARPGALAEVARRASMEPRPLVELEREVVGFDHAELGRALALRWHFPAALQRLIAGHHDEADDPEQGLLQVADRLSHELGQERVLGDRTGEGLRPGDLERIGVDGDWIGLRLESLEAEVESAQEFMNLL